MNAPKLRFKNAKGECYPEWENAQIGDYVDFLSGYPFDGDDITEDKSGVLLMRGTNITEGAVRNSLDIDRYYVGNISKLEKFLLKENDLVIGMDGSKVGKNSALVKGNNINSLLVQRVARLRETKLASIFYVYQNINSFRFHTYVDKVKTSSGIPHISAKQIKEFEIKLPCIEEQTKIANFLTAVDEKITQLTQKCELLAQYKKGVMQQLFSQELRFKDVDGQDFPEWDKKVLGDISVKKSSNIAANKIEDNEGLYKIYGAAGVLKKVDFFTEDNAYISIVKDGAGVGRVFLCEPLSSVLGTMDIIHAKEKVNISFLFAVLEQIDFAKYVTGSTIPHIYYKDYSKETVELPCLKEQTKIANFLTAIDDKLTHTKNQLAATKQYKQGLLQQMFV